MLTSVVTYFKNNRMDPPWYHRIASLACDADFILPDPVSGRYLVSGWEDITGKSKGTVSDLKCPGVV